MLWFLYGETLSTRLLSWLPSLSQRSLHVLFVGDTSFGENYHDKSFFESRGYDFFLKELDPLLCQSDLVIANLETPLTNLDRSFLEGKKRFIHWGDIQKTPKTLQDHHIRFVSLANNHTLDYGIVGLLQTQEALNKNDIAWFGAGADELEASEPLRRSFTVEGYPFELIVVSGFAYGPRHDSLFHCYANGDVGGVKMWTIRRAADQLLRIRQADNNAFIVAFPHWGQDCQFKDDGQTKLAHTLIDAGADLVIGHGSHIFQEIEQYRGRWIIYSLGNFAFNFPGSCQKFNAHPFSLTASLEVTRQEESLVLALKLYPILSDNLICHYQPRLVTNEELSRIKDILIWRSLEPAFLQKHVRTGEDKVGGFLALEM
ncbi:MAG: CapA family protein [Deltaproteobacteria bacterium]|nr:CapA family protein [Deltaproteobacteria bacterium]